MAVPLVAGDFNEDGHLDLATSSSGGVELLAGQGDGSFILTTLPISVQAFPFVLQGSAVADDFNLDGRTDLAVAENSGLAILPGEGDGNFGSPIFVSVPGKVFAVVSDDFNGDGRSDLAVVFKNSRENGVAVLLGNGDGTFAAQKPYDFPGDAFSLATGDFNGDGRPDLVVGLNDDPGGGIAGGGIAFMAGNGDGTFATATPIITSTPLPPILSLAKGDFNGDGIPDIAADYNDSSGPQSGSGVAVFLGVKGGAPLSPSGSCPVQFSSGVLVSGDFAGDDRIDLAAGQFNFLDQISGIQILLGDGHGSFTPSTDVLLPPGTGQSLAAGNFAGDGRTDLVASFDFSTGTGSGERARQPVLVSSYGTDVLVFTGAGIGSVRQSHHLLESEARLIAHSGSILQRRTDRPRRTRHQR